VSEIEKGSEMSNLIIAAVQSGSIKGDIHANIQTHVEFVRVAAEYLIDVIIFPELSLTGFEPEIAQDCAITINDERLAPLKDQAEKVGITIICGAPIASPTGKPYIGALIINSGKPRIYHKAFLHPGEKCFFSPGSQKSCVINVKGVNIGVAVCADIHHASHAEEAAKQGASVYAAGVLIMNDYTKAAKRMQQYATEHSMMTLMANHASPTGSYIPVGKSAIWNNSGKLLAIADETGYSIVVAMEHQAEWIGKTIKL
jgi:predicted amidohydrolase